MRHSVAGSHFWGDRGHNPENHACRREGRQEIWRRSKASQERKVCESTQGYEPKYYLFTGRACLSKHRLPLVVLPSLSALQMISSPSVFCVSHHVIRSRPRLGLGFETAVQSPP